MIRSPALLLAFLPFAFGSSASAQCASGPDGLTGPCCQFVPLSLPTFPTLTLPATAICWNNCAPSQVCALVTIATPTPVTCDEFSSALLVSDCTGLLQVGGSLVLDYSRTWEEFDSAAMRRLQVYRFVAKIDMDASGTHPCFVPACFTAFPQNFYYGYVDYAIDCTTGGVEAALMLFHNCDAFIHHPLSTNPAPAGGFHPNLSFAIVAPSTAANPFVAGTAPIPAGAMTAEAVRLAALPGAACLTEDPISSGGTVFLGSGCGCVFAPAPAQLSARRLSGTGTCLSPVGTPTTFMTANAMPSFPWFHEMATAIGFWSTPVGYPGEEFCWANEAPVFYRDACSARLGLAGAFGEVYYGASTQLGYTVVPAAGVALTDKFTDLAANTSWTVPGPPPATFMGKVLPTRNLIYFNVP